MKMTSDNLVSRTLTIAFLVLAATGCDPTCEQCAKIAGKCAAGTSATGGEGATGGGGAGGVGGGETAGSGGTEGGMAGAGGMAPGGPQGFPFGTCANALVDCTPDKMVAAGFDKTCLTPGNSCGPGSLCYAYLRSGGQCNKVGATNACYKAGNTNHTTSCGAYPSSGGAPTACQWGACN